ncbi:tRNA glutamyl-Q(34) synthetase GluQRS [Oxalobacter vibrioformis]|uniref:Glutamyl-Q tRNA(Asp) synthetase n=1 Tax=Oxalobacter vibrioformis TaxID=933080 RepID=A0A9E9P2U4_9BURK|nr:tRNA glutamyl-Q(34) synthetase GluQRS [Oxalobacter vibrioformis]WAW10287.1 tRNA glutamyl-Q(34) synthetase GluQRS [Oxalobacter vibrioformis]
MNTEMYRGRFAPSPTGPLHFGSLVAAAGSYLDACASNGEWLVRMEDVDRPRCRPEYDRAIMLSLEAYGFQWNGSVMRQSDRTKSYQAALDALRGKNLVYPCACSRKEISDSNIAHDGAHIYPGTCAAGLPPGETPRAWRIRVSGQTIRFVDLVQGSLSQDLSKEVGDFVLLRADGCFAYQMAVVVDDAQQGITRIVRGADLLDSTPRQIYLQHCLGVSFPEYAHLPVAVNTTGEKLSKQTRARALDDKNPVPALLAVFEFLEMPSLKGNDTSLDDLWKEAVRHWSLDNVPAVRTILSREMRQDEP